MGWTPKPRYDKHNRQWIVRYQKRRHYLGRDYPTAVKRFAEIIGHEPHEDAPEHVIELATQWLRVYGNEWHARMLQPWLDFAADKPIDSIDTDHLDKYLRFLKVRKSKHGKLLAKSTIRHYVKVASRVCRWAVKRDWLHKAPEQPKLSRSQPKPRDVPLEILANALADVPQNARDVLEFIVETGARPSEAIFLLWAELRMDTKSCVLEHHKTDDSVGVRVLYLTPRAIEILESRPQVNAFVFNSRLGKPYTVSGLRSVAKRFERLPDLYSLRHTRAQTLLASQPLENVAKILGHKSVSTTQIYAQVRDDRASEIASQQSRIVPEPPSVEQRSRKDAAASRGSRAKHPRSRGESSKARRRRA